MLFSVPAGAVIWLAANVHVRGASVATHLIAGLLPLGLGFPTCFTVAQIWRLAA